MKLTDPTAISNEARLFEMLTQRGFRCVRRVELGVYISGFNEKTSRRL